MECLGCSLAHSSADGVSICILTVPSGYVTMHESRQDQIEEDCKGDQRLSISGGGKTKAGSESLS